LTLALVAACGSKPPPKDPHQAELEAAEKRDAALEKEKPKDPYETKQRAAAHASERCGQGPYRLTADALHARYGEELIVYACGPHELQGNYRLTVERPHDTATSDERAFGWARDNRECKAGPAVTANGAGAGSSAGKGSGSGSAKPTATAPAKLAPTKLETAEVPASCSRWHVVDQSWISGDDTPALAAGTHFVIDIWSDEPNDLDKAVFVVEQKAVEADMTVERWKAYLDAEHRWFERYRANVDADVKSGRTKLLDDTVKTPPPPSRAEPHRSRTEAATRDARGG
jgi:hypothetical protein